MNTWDLTDLYPSLDDASFHQDIASLDKAIEDFEVWSTSISTLSAQEVLESYIDQSTYISTTMTRLGAFASLTSATDASNTQALNALNQIQVMGTKTVNGQVALVHYLKTQIGRAHV